MADGGVFVVNVPSIAKSIWRYGHSLKSSPTDWRARDQTFCLKSFENTSLGNIFCLIMFFSERKKND